MDAHGTVLEKRAPAASITLLPLLGALSLSGLAACSDPEAGQPSPDATTGGASGKADDPETSETGTADSGSSSETGGEPPVDPRGDPNTFPTDCLDCEEACLVLDECGGLDPSHTSLESYKECVYHCVVGGGFDEGAPDEGAPDEAETFRCCTSQDSCDAVSSCGGWLSEPSVDAACEGICSCQNEGADVGTVTPNGLLVAEGQVVVQSESGYRLRQVGELGGPDETVLPTFVTAWGDVVAATPRVIIRLDAGVSESTISSVGAGQVTRSQRLAYGDRVHIADTATPAAALALAERLSAVPGVSAEPDLVRFYALRHVPNDPEFGQQWHLLNEGYSAAGQSWNAATPGVDARLSEAWNLTLGSPEVIIAVNDDGVDLNHPDLQGKLLPELHYPPNWQDIEGFGSHGTPVAGVAAATGDNGIGGSGACPGCSILPSLITPDLNAQDPSGLLGLPDSDIAQVHVNLVDAGAWVISNSWGPADGPAGLVNNPEPQPMPMVIAEAFEYAETEGRGGLGTVILFAAGNGNETVSADPLPSAPTTVAVSAIDDTGLKASYSDFGPEISIGAPSDGGFHGVFTTAPLSEGGYTDAFGGTSSATPLVAGVVGLVLSVAPELTAAQVRALLRDSATPVDPANGQWNDGHSPYYGHGMVNAYRAVQMAMSNCEGIDCEALSDLCLDECEGTSCAPCRNDDYCAEGFACQAVAELGQTMCIPEAAAGSCPPGHTLAGTLCIPTRAECGACEATDPCNGRDDDCSGQPDDAEACDLCVTHDACAAGEACLEGGCIPTCDSDATCLGEKCLPVATRYGEPDGDLRSCRDPDFQALCVAECSVRNSNAPISSVEEFGECGAASEACEDLFACGG